MTRYWRIVLAILTPFIWLYLGMLRVMAEVARRWRQRGYDFRVCPDCQWSYYWDEWGGKHRVPAHNYPKCPGTGKRPTL